MLLEMKVANFRSIKEPTSLSFAGLNDKRLDPEKVSTGAGGIRVLKTVAIIGPNGAGKSTFVRALEALKAIVCAPDEAENPLSRAFAGTAFAYTDVKGLPSDIEIKVLLPEPDPETGKSITAIYRIVADSQKVFSESLVYSFGNSKTVMFERKLLPSLDESVCYSYRWGKPYRGEKKKLQKKLPPNRSYLAEAAKKGGETCSFMYNWIKDNLHVVPMGAATASENYVAQALVQHPSWAKMLVDYLWSLDITDIRLVRSVNGRLQFVHTNVTQHYACSFMGESLSLRRLAVMGIAFFESFTSQKTLVVDDFGMFLHPTVIKHVLGVFDRYSYNGSQLVCVDCNPALLEDGLLRKDAIWFAQKGKTGATEYSCLSDYRLSNVKDKARYLYENGAFGALPLVSEFCFREEE